MLEQGGNAVDAAVASGLASMVTAGEVRTVGAYGGTMVIYFKQVGEPIIVDFNSRLES
jgi:gamma-glutamyltranspeptidase